MMTRIVHAGAVRSDPKQGDPARWPDGLGPQADEVRLDDLPADLRSRCSGFHDSMREGS